MFRRLLGLFRRYARQHRHLVLKGFSFGAATDPKTKARDVSGLTGHVDRVVMRGDKLTFSGWTTAERITLISSVGKAVTRPNILRNDVAAVHGIAPQVGFELTQPLGDSGFSLRLEGGGEVVTCPCAPVGKLRFKRDSLMLFWRFVGALIQCAPAARRALYDGDPAARAEVKRILGLDTRPEAAPMDAQLFAAPPDPSSAIPVSPGTPVIPVIPVTNVTIVLPVYNAFSLLPEVLDRVVRHTDLPWHLVIIEDGSSDDRVRPWLSDWVAAQEAGTPGRITLLVNPENRGFIRSVNRGFAEALGRGDHVLLLNSDAFVPDRWASRLLRPILTRDKVATVTPMSNDAEIFSVPTICARTVIAPGQGDLMDALAQRVNPEATLPAVPTGVGFCMAMNIDYLRRIPEFDTAFGRGYGEEVDWCQKIRAQGGQHLGLPGLFVEHRGGESFGTAEKLKLVQKNNEIIARRYPPYDMEIQDFIAADPLVTARLALALAWAVSRPEEADAPRGFPLYIAHSLGGGAELYLDRRIAADLKATGRPAVVLRLGGPARWQVELLSATGRVAGMTADWAFVKDLLAPLTRRHIVYSCAVGDPDPVALPDLLLELKGPGDTLDILFHDFFPLSPSYTLLDADGGYRGPVPETRDDKAHRLDRPNGARVALPEWRRAWGKLMAAASEIVVFSEDSRAHVAAAYPECTDQLVLRPHQMLAAVPQITAPKTDTRTVAILGNIGYQKGAAVAVELGRLMEAEPGFDLVMIGNVDPAYTPPLSVPVHGDYALAELPDLVARYQITDWLIPSVWPETFSFTTHEALATGLPVYAFDIGAQGATVGQAPNGRLIPFTAGAALAQDVLATLRTVPGRAGASATQDTAAPSRPGSAVHQVDAS